MNRGLARPLAVAALALVPAAAGADVIKLKSGGEVRGMLVGTPDGGGDGALTIETLSGGVVAVPRGDVEFVTRRPRAVEEYEVRAKSAADTVDSQWGLAEWCRSNGLEEERRGHLSRVVELERDHAAARAALGQTKFDGEWLTREEVMAKRGLVQHKGRWITPAEVDLIEKTEAEREREQAWFAEMRKIRAWLRGTNDDMRRQAVDRLRALRDPDAVPALAKTFRDDPDPALRGLYVSVLAGMPGAKPVAPLVTQALHDVDQQVRYAAFAAIDESRREDALPYFLQGLRSDSNEVVRRAGLGLQDAADERAIPDLIKALITTHRYRVQVPDDTPTYSFAKSGTFGPGGVPLPPDIDLALRTGALPYGVTVIDPTRRVRTKAVTISVNQENPEVLAALRKITGESFGFDERTWRLWWATKKNSAG